MSNRFSIEEAQKLAAKAGLDALDGGGKLHIYSDDGWKIRRLGSVPIDGNKTVDRAEVENAIAGA